MVDCALVGGLSQRSKPCRMYNSHTCTTTHQLHNRHAMMVILGAMYDHVCSSAPPRSYYPLCSAPGPFAQLSPRIAFPDTLLQAKHLAFFAPTQYPIFRQHVFFPSTLPGPGILPLRPVPHHQSGQHLTQTPNSNDKRNKLLKARPQPGTPTDVGPAQREFELKQHFRYARHRCVARSKDGIFAPLISLTRILQPGWENIFDVWWQACA